MSAPVLDEPLEQVAQLSAFGQPWHGSIAGETLTLSNGQQRPVTWSQLLGSDGETPPQFVEHTGYRGFTRYIRFEGLPAVPAASESEQEQGVQWRDDAVLFGGASQYSPDSAVAVLPYPLFRDVYGLIWEVDVELIYPAELWTSAYHGLRATGGSVSIAAHVRRMADIGGTAGDWRTRLTITDAIDIGPVLSHVQAGWESQPGYSGNDPKYVVPVRNNDQGSFEWSRYPPKPCAVEQSPGGDRLLVSLRYRAGDLTHGLPWIILKVYRIVLASAAVEGDPPNMEWSVAKDEGACTAWSVGYPSAAQAVLARATPVPAGPPEANPPTSVPWVLETYLSDSEVAAFGGAAISHLMVAAFDAGGQERYLSLTCANSGRVSWTHGGSVQGGFTGSGGDWSGAVSYDFFNVRRTQASYTYTVLINGEAVFELSESLDISRRTRERATWSLDPSDPPQSPYVGPGHPQQLHVTLNETIQTFGGGGGNSLGGSFDGQSPTATWTGPYVGGYPVAVEPQVFWAAPPAWARTNNIVALQLPIRDLAASPAVRQLVVLVSASVSSSPVVVGLVQPCHPIDPGYFAPPGPYLHCALDPRSGQISWSRDAPVGWC